MKLMRRERKEMLERFKSAGGQVLKEKSVAEKAEDARRAAEAKSGPGAGGQSFPVAAVVAGLPETKLPSELRREREREESDKAQRARQEYEKALKKISGAGARVLSFACGVFSPGLHLFRENRSNRSLCSF
jgi:hypothetical protein